MSEWKEYSGSDEQIADLYAARHGVLIQYKNSNISSTPLDPVKNYYDLGVISNLIESKNIIKYFLCNPHPLADMICQQARTGQPVWIRQPSEFREGEWFYLDVTTTPDWYRPNAEYSFTKFKGELNYERDREKSN